MELTHRQQKTLRSLSGRQGRRKSEYFVAEGHRCCAEALRQAPDLVEFGICTDAAPPLPELDPGNAMGDRVVRLPEAEFASYALTENPQGILLVLRRPSVPPPGSVTDPFVLVLDRLGEPGNVGTILRTAWAIGLREVCCTNGTTDPFGPKAIRAGMGAQFGLVIRTGGTLRDVVTELGSRGCVRTWCTVPHGGISCYADEFRLPGSALIIGNEANGISDPGVGDPVSIPMPGEAESLNAAQAATIFLFEGVRRGLLGTP